MDTNPVSCLIWYRCSKSAQGRGVQVPTDGHHRAAVVASAPRPAFKVASWIIRVNRWQHLQPTQQWKHSSRDDLRPSSSPPTLRFDRLLRSFDDVGFRSHHSPPALSRARGAPNPSIIEPYPPTPSPTATGIFVWPCNPGQILLREPLPRSLSLSLIRIISFIA